MTSPKLLAVWTFSAAAFLATPSSADIVLTFDQDGLGNGTQVNPDYGDQVTAASDSVGSYGVVAGTGDLFTPNVEVSYDFSGFPALWTTNYSDLNNVLYNEIDFDDSLEVSFFADPGFEVGLHEFDLGAFGSGETIAGVSIFDGDSNVLWSTGSASIDGTIATSFSTGGIFAETLILSVDLTGLDDRSDNVGIDNIRFSQQASIPEPAAGSVLLLGCCLGLLRRRRRVV